MKKVILSSLVALTTLLGPFNVYAAEKFNYEEFINDVKIDSDENQITIKWSEVPDAVAYRVYHGDSEVYNGTNDSFVHDDLESGKPYNYTLMAVNSDEEVIAKITLGTKTINPKKKTLRSNDSSNDFLVNDVNVATISNGEFIRFDWNNVPDVEEFEVIKNGTVVDKISESEFSDEVDGGKEKVVYEFRGKIPVNKQEREIRLSKIEKNISEQGDASLKTEDLLYDYVSIIKVVDKKKLKSLANLSNNEVDNVKIRYTTFIGDKYVENPVPYALRLTGEDWEEEVEYFGGDNRDFAVSHSRFRTQVNIEADFTDELLDIDKDVNKTTMYDKNKNLLSTARASSSGIKLNKNVVNQDEMDFRLNHSVGIPYLEDSFEFTPPEIDYRMDGEIFREDGSYRFDGWHDGAPSHELYISFDNGPYEEVFTHDLYDFFYLFEVTPKHYFDISN
ncbi:DUF3238 domain-containing protein [Brevibacillus porteri]|uniref:DUF3238 domain-containing protein n=1 Tax=Brevibacillus porteri TaxID=2126350 RepID=A0ABX5FFJ0_9BACL|nr:DUF3238 domain-containing protein [Brevibacillus porteri]MED1803068.1 DUF3238 domain-containing protein [Brevibacillus porteri]MED2135334.1 DUF3238 domain-containing protein [Brevibacillus porteri]MED2748758.1 DUF3238 domain-containing protein [Brevibacillus porteri]MED2818412.1 DUF3238 domain-containing protein [Brevibacillus porteri]MED4899568.1 DUF3238 domain-containing protein [Brevibacillus porteri]